MDDTPGETRRFTRRLIVRVVLVFVISIFYLGTTLPDIVTPWCSMGHFGFAVDMNGNVVQVDPGTPAARAGVRTGGRLNFAATPIASRRHQYGGIPDVAEPGSHAVFVFDRGATRLAIPIVAGARRSSFAGDVSESLFVLSKVVPALVGACLLLLRPSRMTWMFFLYTTGTRLLCTSVIQSQSDYSLRAARESRRPRSRRSGVARSFASPMRPAQSNTCAP